MHEGEMSGTLSSFACKSSSLQEGRRKVGPTVKTPAETAAGQLPWKEGVSPGRDSS